MLVTMSSAVIIYYNENNTIKILTGIESYYCYEDKTDDPIYNELLLNWQTPSSREEASMRAYQLSMYYKTRIQYTLPDKDNIIHYSCITNQSKIGIIKGGIEKNEDSLETIQREVKEEIGVIIPSNRFIKAPLHIPRTTIYLLPINYKEMKWIEYRIKERQEQLVGEIFNLEFRTIYEIKKSDYKMNSVTSFMCSHSTKLIVPLEVNESIMIPSSPRSCYTPFLLQPIRPLHDSWKRENGTWKNNRVSLLELL